MADAPRSDDSGRDETPTERADRNWSELLQELRVVETGVQILTGFLLTLPFQQRFAGLSGREEALYLVVLLLSIVTTGLVVAPVAFHRILFRHHEKGRLVSAANALAGAGLLFLALSVCGVCLLVVEVVLNGLAAVIATAGVATFFVLVWLVVPLRSLRRGDAGVGS